MTLQELQTQALQLSVDDRLQLIAVLQRSLPTFDPKEDLESLETSLHPWTQSLIGVIEPPKFDTDQDYLQYLEEKYR